MHFKHFFSRLPPVEVVIALHGGPRIMTNLMNVHKYCIACNDVDYRACVAWNQINRRYLFIYFLCLQTSILRIAYSWWVQIPRKLDSTDSFSNIDISVVLSHADRFMSKKREWSRWLDVKNTLPGWFHVN